MRRRSPDLTVIVIAYDVRDEVLRCLDALHRNRGELELQIVLVDNASRDGTAAAVRAAFPEVEVVSLAANVGVSARNSGLRSARGRHRMFLDSDAFVTEHALQTLVRRLDESPELGLVGPRLESPDGTLQLSARRFPPRLLPLLRRPPLSRWFEDSAVVRHHLMADDPHDRPRRVEYVLGACQVFRAEAQAVVGEIPRGLFFGPDDALWCFRIRRGGFDIGYEPSAVVVHDYRRTSARRPLSLMALRHLTAFVEFQWKWRRERGALIAEGRAMDAEADRARRAADRT